MIPLANPEKILLDFDSEVIKRYQSLKLVLDMQLPYICAVIFTVFT